MKSRRNERRVTFENLEGRELFAGDLFAAPLLAERTQVTIIVTTHDPPIQAGKPVLIVAEDLAGDDDGWWMLDFRK